MASHLAQRLHGYEYCTYTYDGAGREGLNTCGAVTRGEKGLKNVAHWHEVKRTEKMCRSDTGWKGPKRCGAVTRGEKDQKDVAQWRRVRKADKTWDSGKRATPNLGHILYNIHRFKIYLCYTDHSLVPRKSKIPKSWEIHSDKLQII